MFVLFLVGMTESIIIGGWYIDPGKEETC